MSNIQDLYDHVLETAPATHPERRARIYRGLSEIIGDDSFARRLVARAEACEALQRDDNQLALDFRKKRDGREE